MKKKEEKITCDHQLKINTTFLYCCVGVKIVFVRLLVTQCWNNLKGKCDHSSMCLWTQCSLLFYEQKIWIYITSNLYLMRWINSRWGYGKQLILQRLHWSHIALTFAHYNIFSSFYRFFYLCFFFFISFSVLCLRLKCK